MQSQRDEQRKDPEGNTTKAVSLACGVFGVLAVGVVSLPSPLAKIVGVCACGVVGAATTKVVLDHDRGRVDNWLVGLLALALASALALVAVLAFAADSAVSTTTPSTGGDSKESQLPDEQMPQATSSPQANSTTSTTPSRIPERYELAIDARQIILPASDFTEAYEADLDKPEVGKSISGGDVVVPSDVNRVFQGDPVSDTTIALAPADQIDDEECEALAREQPVESVPLDRLVPEKTAFCLITDEESVAYLKFIGRQSGEDLVFTLTLWRPNIAGF